MEPHTRLLEAQASRLSFRSPPESAEVLGPLVVFDVPVPLESYTPEIHVLELSVPGRDIGEDSVSLVETDIRNDALAARSYGIRGRCWVELRGRKFTGPGIWQLVEVPETCSFRFRTDPTVPEGKIYVGPLTYDDDYIFAFRQLSAEPGTWRYLAAFRPQSRESLGGGRETAAKPTFLAGERFCVRLVHVGKPYIIYGPRRCAAAPAT
ncbi:MAG: hypothetical protein AAGI50_08575 [Pseudomonadota bacterium]